MAPADADPVTDAQRRYVLVETIISMGINILISIGIMYAVFGGTDHLAIRALIPDALPQSFMIALMSTIMPTLLTRKRLRLGAIDRLPARRGRSLVTRALIAAIAAAIAGVALHAALLSLFAPGGLRFAPALAFKALYGGALAAIVTPVMLRAALSEPAPKA